MKNPKHEIRNPKQIPNAKFKCLKHSVFGFNYCFEFRDSHFGFTLIEAVTSVSVFAVAIASIIGVYTSVQRLNKQSTALQALQQNTRFISEDMTRTIRNGTIDYARYGGSVGQPYVSELYLRDKDNAQIRIYKSGDNLVIEKTGIGSSQFTGNEVKVLDFKVYIWPATNPFLSSGTEQPTVTVFVDLESNINPREKARLPFQITVSTRQYPD